MATNRYDTFRPLQFGFTKEPLEELRYALTTKRTAYDKAVEELEKLKLARVSGPTGTYYEQRANELNANLVKDMNTLVSDIDANYQGDFSRAGKQIAAYRSKMLAEFTNGEAAQLNAMTKDYSERMAKLRDDKDIDKGFLQHATGEFQKNNSEKDTFDPVAGRYKNYRQFQDPARTFDYLDMLKKTVDMTPELKGVMPKSTYDSASGMFIDTITKTESKEAKTLFNNFAKNIMNDPRARENLEYEAKMKNVSPSELLAQKASAAMGYGYSNITDVDIKRTNNSLAGIRLKHELDKDLLEMSQVVEPIETNMRDNLYNSSFNQDNFISNYKKNSPEYIRSGGFLNGIDITSHLSSGTQGFIKNFNTQPAAKQEQLINELYGNLKGMTTMPKEEFAKRFRTAAKDSKKVNEFRLGALGSFIEEHVSTNPEEVYKKLSEGLEKNKPLITPVTLRLRDQAQARVTKEVLSNLSAPAYLYKDGKRVNAQGLTVQTAIAKSGNEIAKVMKNGNVTDIMPPGPLLKNWNAMLDLGNGYMLFTKAPISSLNSVDTKGGMGNQMITLHTNTLHGISASPDGDPYQNPAKAKMVVDPNDNAGRKILEAFGGGDAVKGNSFFSKNNGAREPVVYLVPDKVSDFGGLEVTYTANMLGKDGKTKTAKVKLTAEDVQRYNSIMAEEAVKNEFGTRKYSMSKEQIINFGG